MIRMTEQKNQTKIDKQTKQIEMKPIYKNLKVQLQTRKAGRIKPGESTCIAYSVKGMLKIMKEQVENGRKAWGKLGKHSDVEFTFDTLLQKYVEFSILDKLNIEVYPVAEGSLKDGGEAELEIEA
jgi:hypothetical protein